MTRSHFFVPSSLQEGGHIHVRSVVPDDVSSKTPSVVCLHGAAMHNIIFDVPIDEGQSTFLEYLADQGFAAYAISYRGYGESSKPVQMDEDPLPCRSIMRSDEARQDVVDVLRHLQNSQGTQNFHVCGLSWGSVIAGSLVNHHPDLVDKLVLLGAVYSYPNPAWATLLNSVIGTYRVVSNGMITAMWDAEIPDVDKSSWRYPLAVDLIVSDMLAGDEKWAEQQPSPQCLRIPTGVTLDVIEGYHQRPLYDAALVQCPTLILRGAYDGSSHPLDMENLLRQLGTPDKKMITFGNATHYAIVERNATEMWREISSFFV